MIWDINTRLFHLFLVILIIISILTAKLGLYHIHEISGLTLLSILVFRIYWGFFGSFYSKFKNFNLSYWKLKSFLQNKDFDYYGHNPLGSLSIFTIFTVTFFLIITGLFSTDDVLYDGPLLKLLPKYSIIMTKIHNFLHYLLYVMISLHISAAFYYQFIKKKKIISQMIDGRSREKFFVPKNIDSKRNLIGLILFFVFLLMPYIILSNVRY